MQASSYTDEGELLATEQDDAKRGGTDAAVEEYIEETERDPDTAEGDEDTAADTEPDDTDLDAQGSDAGAVDYEALAESDMAELRREFHEARGIRSIAELDNPVRFAELRELGLSPREAYLATQKTRARRDNRSHLVGSMPSVRGGGAAQMTRNELYQAREIFSGMSDTEIQALYKKVSK